jgi:putative transposase
VTRYRFIQEHGQQYGVRRCCQAVGVSASSFYDWHRRGPSARQLADQRLLVDIGRIYRSSGGFLRRPADSCRAADRLRGALWA